MIFLCSQWSIITVLPVLMPNKPEMFKKTKKTNKTHASKKVTNKDQMMTLPLLSPKGEVLEAPQLVERTDPKLDMV
jgi:hypothetical protein